MEMNPDAIKQRSLRYLYGQLKHARISLGHAEARKNAEEIANLQNKIEVLEWVIGVVIKEDADMKTPEEINVEELKRGLECCIIYLNCGQREESCDVCPYIGKCGRLEKDALAMIRQLETNATILGNHVSLLERDLERMQQERDAAVRDCACFPCYTCRERANGDSCGLCKCESGTSKRSNHEWRGPCKENGGK